MVVRTKSVGHSRRLVLGRLPHPVRQSQPVSPNYKQQIQMQRLQPTEQLCVLR